MPSSGNHWHKLSTDFMPFEVDFFSFTRGLMGGYQVRIYVYNLLDQCAHTESEYKNKYRPPSQHLRGFWCKTLDHLWLERVTQTTVGGGMKSLFLAKTTAKNLYRGF